MSSVAMVKFSKEFRDLAEKISWRRLKSEISLCSSGVWIEQRKAAKSESATKLTSATKNEAMDQNRAQLFLIQSSARSCSHLRLVPRLPRLIYQSQSKRQTSFACSLEKG